jgi:hypothetical protein
MEFERRTTVWVGPDEAFEFFADPANLPLYVPTVTFEEAIAVDGDPAAEPDAEAGATGAEARFLPDRNTRRVEWGLADDAYGGSIDIRQGTPSSSDVTIRLHTPDDVDRSQVEGMIEQVVRTIGRHLSGR